MICQQSYSLERVCHNEEVFLVLGYFVGNSMVPFFYLFFFFFTHIET